MTPQNEAFAEALKQLYESYPTDSEQRLSERAKALDRLRESGHYSALIWARDTGIPNDELNAVAMLIYGDTHP